MIIGASSCSRSRRFAYLIGRGCTRDFVIAPMTQIMPLPGDAVLCFARNSDGFAVSIRRLPLASTETRGAGLCRCQVQLMCEEACDYIIWLNRKVEIERRGGSTLPGHIGGFVLLSKPVQLQGELPPLT